MSVYSSTVKKKIADEVGDYIEQYINYVPRQVLHELIDEIYVSDVMDE
jgi:hypothetical protein